jgi:aspartyl-tRNA(Asn)/glutamyl-tRNA(Gln) amidotransferase subunit B
LIEDGGKVIQETLLWDANQNVAVAMRSKEEAHDYRYFPEPDLVPVVADAAFVERVRTTLAEHPTVRRDRFVSTYELPKYDADLLTSEKEYADYFETALAALKSGGNAQVKQVGNWVMGDVLRVTGERKISVNDFPVSPKNLASMVDLVAEGVISSKMAKEVFEEMLKSNEDAKTIVEKKGLVQISDESAIDAVVVEILAKNQAQVEKYKAGGEKVFGFFVGEVMRATKGKANPAVVNSVLKKRLG